MEIKLSCCQHCSLEQVLALQISPSTYLSNLTVVNQFFSSYFFGPGLKAPEGQQSILWQPEILDFKARLYVMKETKECLLDKFNPSLGL